MNILYVYVQQSPILKRLRALITYTQFFTSMILQVRTQRTVFLKTLPAHLADVAVGIVVGELMHPEGVLPFEAFPADLTDVGRVDLQMIVILFFICKTENQHLFNQNVTQFYHAEFSNDVC